jgi:hypothetical protein
MQNSLTKRGIPIFTILLLLYTLQLKAQDTHIKGFVEANTTYQDGKLNFGFGEQDLFITSQVSDRLSFLGETVFKFSLGSPTSFDISVERIVLKYNYYNNHNILIGKHHTPINYWNDTYHHGRVLFPTIDRPLLFAANILPLHTVGVDFQGQNLGDMKFGYDLMIGNGIGSNEIIDNDKRKSITAAVHIKPVEELRIGASYYNDVISKGARIHSGHILNWKVDQHLVTGSIAYFGNKFELLTEGTFASNHSDTTGNKHTIGSYLYGGIKIKEKWVPYVRLDYIHYQDGEVFYQAPEDTKSIVVGLRHEISYLAVIKLEYQYENRQFTGNADRIIAQLAIGF